MPPLDFENGLPDIPDEDYRQWRNDQWRDGAQEQLDQPLKDMPAPSPTPASNSQPDDFVAQATQELAKGAQDVASSASDQPQDHFVQDAQKQLAEGAAQIPTALPKAGDGGSQPDAPLPGTPGVLPADSGWQSGILQGVNAPITPENVAFLNDWNRAEGNLSGGSGLGINNPMNTTNKTADSRSVNSVGVQAFGSLADGIALNARTIAPPSGWTDYYPTIRAALRSGDPRSFFGDPKFRSELDTWGTGQGFLGSPNGTPAPSSLPAPSNPSPPPAGNKQDGNGILGALGSAKDWLGGAKDQLLGGLGDFFGGAGTDAQGLMGDVTGLNPDLPVGPGNQGSLPLANAKGPAGLTGSPDPFRSDVASQGLDPNNPLDLGQYTSDKLANAISQATVGQDYDQTAVGQSLVGPVLKAVLDPVQWLTFAAGGAAGDVAAGALGGGKALEIGLPAAGRALANGVLSANEAAEQSDDPHQILKGFVQGVAAGGLMEGGTLAVSKALGSIFARVRGHAGNPLAPAADDVSPTAGRTPLPEVQDAAREYNQQAGLSDPQQLPYVQNDVPTQQRIAQAFDQAPHAPDDPATRSSYQALGNEVEQQYQFLTDKGVKFEPFTGADPYFSASPTNPSKAMQADVRDNNHLWVYAGDNQPGGLTPDQNWKFRAVHDYFGHAADGNSFGPRGEENAWLAHRQMFSDEAIPALTTETRGQNSWVNFGSYSDLPRSERPFADQKATLLPEEFHNRPMGGGSGDMLKPGEALGISKPEDMPNYGTLSKSGLHFDPGGLGPTGDTKGAGFVIPRPTKTQLTADVVRPFVRDLRPNIRIPYADALSFDPNATRFTEAVSRNRGDIASGAYRPEAAAVGHFATLGSIQRAASSYTRFLDAAGDEAAQRMRPDLSLQNTISRNDPKGVTVRPEVAAAHFVGDTTNPAMMELLYAVSHPGSFGGESGRDAVIEQGVHELYDKMRVAGHGSRNDPSTIQGLPIRRGNGAMSGPMPTWKDSFPALWQKTVDWAKGDKSFREGLLDDYTGAGKMPGEGKVKGRFAAAMSGVSPEPATLDARMMTDVYGLRGDQAANLTKAEYEYLTQQLVDATGAKSGYEGQWGTWSYVGGSKTSYDSLLRVQQSVSDFFSRAEKLAHDTGQKVEDVIPKLAGEEAKTDVQLGDPSIVTSQIGLASDRIQGLPTGSPWSVIKEKAPQLDALARQAGLEVVGGVKTGLGFWREGEKADFEKNFNLVVRGPKSAVEWFAAAMAKMEPSAYGDSQGAVLVTHYGAGGSTPAIKMPTRGLAPEAAEALANRLIEHVNGFDMGWENVRSGQGHIHMVGLDEAGAPLDPTDFQIRVNKVAQALREEGIATTGSTEVQLADARVIHSDDYDRIIRGGPRGAYSPEDNRPLESAADAGGAGDRSPPGGARPAEGGPDQAALRDNDGRSLVPSQEDDGLTHLNAGLRIPGRSIAGGALGAAAGNISTPADATDEERHQRIAAGAAAGALGGFFGPGARDMIRPALSRVALRTLGKETTSDIASRMGDLGYRWNRALAPLRNVPDDVRGAFVDFGNRRLQNQQIAKSLELEGEARFGKTGSDTNGLRQAMAFEEGDLKGETPAQQDYIDRMQRFGRASNSVGNGKGFIFGDATEPMPIGSAPANPGEFSDKTRPTTTPGGFKPMQNAGPEQMKPEQYFPHLYETVKATAQKSARRLGLSPKDFFSYQREAPTLREAQTLGWKPVDGFTQTWSQYVNRFLDSEAKSDLLSQLQDSGAVSKVKGDEASVGRMRLGEIDPVFRGYEGTPAVADALKALTQASWFRTDAPGAPLVAGLMNIGSEAKKQLLTLSGFHALTELRQAYRAMPPVQAVKTIGGSLYNLVSLKANGLFRMRNADLFEDAAGHGLTMPGEAGPDVESTVSGELKRRAVGAAMGASFGYGKAKAQGDDDLDALKQGLAYGAAGGLLSGKITDEYAKGLWTRLVPTLKVKTYQALGSKLDDAGKRQTAEFVNNLYGGQNLAKIGRSQTVQDMLRMSFLASDWWEGWARMVGSSIPDTTLGGMSRAFWLKTAAVDGAFALEGLNLAFNGHLTNDNEDGRQFELETTGLLDKLGIAHQGRQYLDILGPIQPLLKLATTGNLGRFYESRTSIPGSIALQLHENKDYGTGQPIIEPGTTATKAVPQMAGSVIQRVAPVGLQQADSARTSGRNIPGEVGSMVTGMRQYSGADKGAQLDRRDTQVQGALDKVMSDLMDTPRYQAATPDERVAMKSDARKQLQQQIGDDIGIAPSKAVQGHERKYAGVDDPAEERHIDLAIQKVQNWTRDPQHYPRPSTEDIMLESRHRGNLTPAYQRERQQLKIGGGDIASLIDKYAPAYSGR